MFIHDVQITFQDYDTIKWKFGEKTLGKSDQ
jgi:hypothetical protein